MYVCMYGYGTCISYIAKSCKFSSYVPIANIGERVIWLSMECIIS